VKHGPFNTQQMLEWWRQGFFRGDYACPVRRLGDSTYCSSESIQWEELAASEQSPSDQQEGSSTGESSAEQSTDDRSS